MFSESETQFITAKSAQNFKQNHFWLDFFPTLLWPLESQQFLGNSDSADRLFRGNLNTIFLHET
jgi:hypothetical protein